MNRSIVIIETPPHVQPFKSCAWMATEDEIKEAKKERPDLIFRLPKPGEQVGTEIEDEVEEEVPEELKVYMQPMSLHGLGKKKLNIIIADSQDNADSSDKDKE